MFRHLKIEKKAGKKGLKTAKIGTKNRKNRRSKRVRTDGRKQDKVLAPDNCLVHVIMKALWSVLEVLGTGICILQDMRRITRYRKSESGETEGVLFRARLLSVTHRN